MAFLCLLVPAWPLLPVSHSAVSSPAPPLTTAPTHLVPSVPAVHVRAVCPSTAPHTDTHVASCRFLLSLETLPHSPCLQSNPFKEFGAPSAWWRCSVLLQPPSLPPSDFAQSPPKLAETSSNAPLGPQSQARGLPHWILTLVLR